MHWERQEVADDKGKDRRYDLMHLSRDQQAGIEWIVSKHDDGTWQWIQWDTRREEPLAMGEGFGSADDAEAAAERYAATLRAAG